MDNQDQEVPQPKRHRAETSPQEAELLRDLKQHPGWKVRTQLFDRHLITALNNAISGDEDNYLRGFYEGMVRSRFMIDWAIADSIDDLEARMKAMPNEVIKRIEF